MLLYFHHLSVTSPLLTGMMLFIYDDDLKLGVSVALMWWAWFQAKDAHQIQEFREKIFTRRIHAVR